MVPAGVKFPVPFDFAFNHGAIVKGLAPARDWYGKFGDGQARDEETGHRLWLALMEDLDPRAAQFGRDRAKVKIAASVQPVLPPPVDAGGVTFIPAELTDLVLTPWVDDARCTNSKNPNHKCRARLAWSMRASGLVAPRTAAAAA
jgi:hypothetical protein